MAAPTTSSSSSSIQAPFPPTTTPHNSASSPVTSSLTTPIPVPTHGPGGNFTIIAKTLIPAPPIQVLSLIRDTNTWSKWNTFCPSSTIISSPPPPPPSPSNPSTSTPSSNIDIQTGKPGWLDPGTKADIDVFMNGDGLIEGRKKSRSQGVVVTKVEQIDEDGDGRKGYRIAWKAVGMSHWQLHSERVMEFLEVQVDGEGGKGGVETEYVCWETFGGVLGPVVKRLVGTQLVDRFGDYARDVRLYFEGLKK